MDDGNSAGSALMMAMANSTRTEEKKCLVTQCARDNALVTSVLTTLVFSWIVSSHSRHTLQQSLSPVG